jgi:hypothetical protein
MSGPRLPRRAPASDGHTGSTIVVSAVAALRRFGGEQLTASRAAALLELWAGSLALRPEQRDAVLARFPGEAAAGPSVVAAVLVRALTAGCAYSDGRLCVGQDLPRDVVAGLVALMRDVHIVERDDGPARRCYRGKLACGLELDIQTDPRTCEPIDEREGTR